MATVRVLQRSFNGGELTPEFFGQMTDAKYTAGVATMRNFVALPHGPATNRPGFAYVREVKDSTKRTRLIPFTFSTTQTIIIEMGAGYFRFHTQGATVLSGGVPYEIANTYAEADLFDIHYVQSADVVTLVHPGYAPRELRRVAATNWTLTTITFGSTLAAPTGPAVVATVGTGATTYSYKVTTVGEGAYEESVATAAVSCTNDLLTTGNKNTVSWTAATGAKRYNVYKESNGLYGYIGQTSALSFVDDNIAPDLSLTVRENLPAFAAGNYPGAVSYFEQRRCFAGTEASPQSLWMTRPGTESNLTYSIPAREDDAINFRVAAREANTIRHLVPLNDLVLLTSSAEWRATSINADAITPSTVSIRPQSYVGANNAQPLIINTTLLYAAARGGHVRELAYNWQAGGYMTGDLSLRAPHLFDNLDIVEMAYVKAPSPVAWFVSSNGKLLGLTYVPDQQVGAWHQHDTDGLFESIAVVAEGNEDVPYVVVKRTINGSSKRYVERMASRQFTDQSDAFFVDAGATFDAVNATATTITVSGGITWDSSEELLVTSSAALFTFPAQTDAGDQIVLEDADGVVYLLTIDRTDSTTQARVYCDRTLAPEFQAVATAAFWFARDSITGLGHLEGKVVSILADGAVHPQRTVTSGAISLDLPVRKAQIGLPITADLQTLPLAVGMKDGSFGQGRFKAVNRAWLRVHRSSGIFVGPDVDNLVEAKQRTVDPYGAPPALKSEEIEVVLSPAWEDAGQVYVRQADPLPLAVVALTLEVALGG